MHFLNVKVKNHFVYFSQIYIFIYLEKISLAYIDLDCTHPDLRDFEEWTCEAVGQTFYTVTRTVQTLRYGHNTGHTHTHTQTNNTGHTHARARARAECRRHRAAHIVKKSLKMPRSRVSVRPSQWLMRGEYFANSKMDNFSLVIDWLSFFKRMVGIFLC